MVGHRSTNKTMCSARSHVIRCRKYRRGVLTGRVETGLNQIIAQVVDEAGGQVIEAEVMPDRGAALWSPSWSVSCVGGAPLEVVRRCVEDQKRAA